MQRHNEGYDNIEVVDGVSKSAILSKDKPIKTFYPNLHEELK